MIIKNNARPAAADRKENVLAGFVGAFLFSLAGGAVWIFLDRIGFYAGISGLVASICAVQGYRIFGGKLSKKGVIIAVVVALLVLVLAWYGCFAFDLLEAYEAWYDEGSIDYTVSYFDCFRSGYLYFSDPGIARDYLISLLVGIGFAVVGSLSYIITTFKSVSAAAPAADLAATHGDPFAKDAQPDEYDNFTDTSDHGGADDSSPDDPGDGGDD